VLRCAVRLVPPACFLCNDVLAFCSHEKRRHNTCSRALRWISLLRVAAMLECVVLVLRWGIPGLCLDLHRLCCS
jgi:hypothetical protein